ncbi:acid-sensing ion channel 1C-like [Glandiceps talaboti]
MDPMSIEINRVSPGSIFHESKEQLTDSESETNVSVRGCKCCCGDEKFRQFCQDTTLHGIRYTTNQNVSIYRRILWSIVMLSVVIGITISTKDSFCRYLSAPVTTVLSFQQRHKVFFPAVTLCNYNKYRKSVIQGTWFDNFTKELSRNTTSIPGKRNDFDWNYYRDKIISLNTTDFQKETAHRMDEMLLMCEWSSDTTCTSSNFTTVMTDFGVCYTFNGDADNMLSVHNRGRAHGMFMVLDVQQAEYTYNSNKGAGIKLLIHSQTDVPLVDELGMALSPAMDTTVALKISNTELIKCKDEKLKYFEKYSNSNCQLESYTEAVASSCNCTGAYMPGNMRDCNLIEEHICVKPAKRNKDIDCPMPCEQTTYGATLSYAAFPSTFFIEELQRRLNVSKQYMTDNYVAVSIYLEDLMILVTKEEPVYPYEDFVGDLGGLLGLGLGASLLTTFEFVEFFVICIVNKCRTFYHTMSKPRENDSIKIT